MGSYISSNNILTTSSRTNSRTTTTRNLNNSKKKKINSSIDLATHFYIGGKKHDLVLNDQNQPFLFGDKSDLNFIFINKPAKVS
jgi:hypothetical protein